MPGGFPVNIEACNGVDYGSATAASTGTAISVASANTKTAYTQLVASTTNDSSWMVVTLGCAGNLFFGGAVDIAIGGAGSEQVIASNLALGYGCPMTWSLPVHIASGTRIAARAQTSHEATDSVDVQVILFDSGFVGGEGYAGVDSIGYLTASSHGTAITASGSANTKGSYIQLTASTSVDYAAIMIYADNNGGSVWSTASSFFLVDIAIGGAGSEQVIVPNFAVSIYNTNGSASGMPAAIIPIAIPSGTRIAARSQFNQATGKATGVTVYGLYE